MRQTLGEFDDRDEGFGLVGEERADELPQRDRRLPMMLLTAFAMALFAGGLWFAYVEGTRHPAAGARSDGVPLIRADQQPDKVRPEQPGGMKIPDQNASIYNETPGGPPVEKLLPAPEQPMPRPAPAPPAAISPTPPSANPPIAAPAAPPLQAEGSPAARPAGIPETARPVRGSRPLAEGARPTRETTHARAARVTASAAPIGRGTPVRVQLGSVRTPEAARAEWARLKREHPDLLGRLTAVAVRVDLGDKGIFYRIEAGAFGNPAAADRLCGALKRRNLGCAVAR